MDRYCGACGGPVKVRPLKGKARGICQYCKKIIYPDLILAVSSIVHDQEDRILLVKRAINPGFGRWVIPGGYVEQGESLIQALRRETLEEVSLDLDDPVLWNVYSSSQSAVATVVYTMKAARTTIRETGSETLQARFFPADHIPWNAIYFASTREALSDWVTSGSKNRPSRFFWGR